MGGADAGVERDLGASGAAVWWLFLTADTPCGDGGPGSRDLPCRQTAEKMELKKGKGERVEEEHQREDKVVVVGSRCPTEKDVWHA